MIEEFLDYLKFELNRSDLTITGYGDDLRAFEVFFKNLDTHLSWESIDSDIIREWMEDMMDKGNSASSINRRLSALRSFFRFALSRKMVSTDPSHCIQGPKKSRPLPQFLKESEMDRILDPKMWRMDDYNDVRTQTIIMTFYETGIRLSELTGLDNKDVDFLNRQLKVTGKRNKQRIIPFGDELYATLEKYVASRAQVPKQSDAFFLSDIGERMKNDKVRYDVRKNLSKVCVLKERTPHVLRHTFATAMLNHDAGLESLRKLLGHASLSTTEIYTHTTFEQLRKVYKNAHPRA